MRKENGGHWSEKLETERKILAPKENARRKETTLLAKGFYSKWDFAINTFPPVTSVPIDLSTLIFLRGRITGPCRYRSSMARYNRVARPGKTVYNKEKRSTRAVINGAGGKVKRMAFGAADILLR